MASKGLLERPLHRYVSLPQQAINSIAAQPSTWGTAAVQSRRRTRRMARCAFEFSRLRSRIQGHSFPESTDYFQYYDEASTSSMNAGPRLAPLLVLPYVRGVGTATAACWPGASH